MIKKVNREQADFIKYGYSDECESCRKMASGIPAPYPHTKKCRERMEAIIRFEEPARWRKAILRKGTSDGPDHREASESEGEGR